MISERTRIYWSGEDGQEFFIEVDAVTREAHQMPNDVTDHPVETGSNISDHIRPQPNTLTLDCVISNAPHYLPADHVGGATWVATDVRVDISTPSTRAEVEVADTAPRLSNIVRTVPLSGAGNALSVGLSSLVPIGPNRKVQVGQDATSRSITARVEGPSQQFDRVQDVLVELIALREGGTLLRIANTLNTYGNMAITLLEFARSSGGADNLTFTLSLKQITIVSTETVAVPVLPTKRVDKGSSKVTPVTPDANTGNDETVLGHYFPGAS
jgi:hypothetical protein